ncbi:protein SSUH2 homolog [Anguilla anguilla]|uniref:Protein SSUH2 homolog n=1 Tax=Anguilla anguilla TaxID=7936 RepID=A0A9D3RMY5_ANGAN|nr:protein SSUH2 homolog [Anguilla anguilla]KAG5836579.1 hypothetical protein ANANG_G00256940 [Anguilla anguilla]
MYNNQEAHAMFPPQGSNFLGATAPPASMFDNVPGYEGTAMGGGGGYLPPPAPAYPPPAPEPSPTQPEWNIPSISEDTAREAFRLFVSNHCCWSSGPAKDGMITAMDSFNTYRYRLETFTEARATEWAHEQYNGQPVNAYTQPAPGPWDIQVQPPAHFQEQSTHVMVPYTSSVKECHECLGQGREPCTECAGAGNKVCWVCNGAGVRTGDDQCNHCNGRGRENCSACHGHGSKECDACRGKRQLHVYIQLNVKWTNNKDDFVVEQSSGLKVENLNSVSGKELFKDTQYLVFPVMGFPDPAVGQAAERLVREHQNKYSQSARILQQRQTIELIPITKVTYKWKGGTHTYFVYGNEFLVSTEDYPATCCCTVM